MANEPNTDEDFGNIVRALYQAGVDIVVGGHWSIAAFDAEHPVADTQAWLKENPPVGRLDIACPDQHQAEAESGLLTMGFHMKAKTPEEIHFEDSRGYTV